jgi:TRAP-type C4-dicarboxylate transport system permease small subunit
MHECKGGARRALDGLYLATGWLAGLFLIAVCALMLTLSIGREIGINLRSGDDLTAWSCAAMAALGLAHTFKSGEMVRVGLLVEGLQGRTRVRVELAVLVLGTLLVGAFAYYACDLVWDSYRFNERAQGVLPVPMWIPQLGMAAGAIVLFIAFLDELVGAASGARPSYAKDPPKTVEEVIERAAQSGV